MKRNEAICVYEVIVMCGSTHSTVGGGRRPPSDIPPHIQQLLEQPSSSSPSRRPVYRKILAGAPLEPSELAKHL